MGCSERCDCLHAVRMNNIQECTVTSVQSASCFPSQLVRASDRHSADAGLIPGGARDFLPRVTFQCRLFFSVSIRPPVQSHALTFVRMMKILQSLSDCVGLWQHKHAQQAPLSTKIINLLIVVAQTQWACCCSMDIFAIYKLSSSSISEHWAPPGHRLHGFPEGHDHCYHLHDGHHAVG